MSCETGWDQLDESQRDQRRVQGGSPQLLVLRPDEQAEVTFVDDGPTLVKLHKVPDKGSRWKSLLCVGKGCVVCSGQKYKLLDRCLFTVVDHRQIEWENRYGREAISAHEVRYLDWARCDAIGLKRMMDKLGKVQLAGETLWITKSGGDKASTLHFMFIERNPEKHPVPPDALSIDFINAFPATECEQYGPDGGMF